MCERDERPLALAKRFWQKAGVEYKVRSELASMGPFAVLLCDQMILVPILVQIDTHVQPAADTLHKLISNGGADSYDFAFIGESFSSVEYLPSLFCRSPLLYVCRC